MSSSSQIEHNYNVGEQRVRESVPFATDYPKRNMKTRSNHKVKICAWQSPFEFYVRLTEEESQMRSLNEEMNKFYSKESPIAADQELSINSMVVVKVAGQYLRARLSDADYRKKRFDAFCIDNGKEECYVKMADIFQMDVKFVKQFPMAIKCSLVDILLSSHDSIEPFVNKDADYQCVFLEESDDVGLLDFKYTVQMKTGGNDMRATLMNNNLLSLIPQGVCLKRLIDQHLKVKIESIKDVGSFFVTIPGIDVKLLAAYEGYDSVNRSDLLDSFKKEYEKKDCVVKVADILSENR